MAYRYLTQLASVLRAAGLDVVEIDGWKTRGRPASTGGFNPVGVLWHHTGAYDGIGDPQSDRDYAIWLAKVGRSDLPAPLCQLSISAEGTVYVCAAGRANHAGTARASGSVAAGDGNSLYIGVECMNSGSQGWPRSQYEAMVKTGAALANMLGTSHRAQRAHRETSTTGKWDPGMLDMDRFRADIKAAMKPEPKPEPSPPKPAPKRLRVVTFNAYVGNKDLRNNLVGLADDADKPHVIVLQEVKGWRGTIPGYERVEASNIEHPHPEARSTVLLVRRRGVEIIREGVVDVADYGGKWWRGPKHGTMHPPRVFPWARLKVDGQPWVVIGVHRTPGGPRPKIKANRASWAAEDGALTLWFKRRPDAPLVAAGDWNNHKSDLRPLSVQALAKRVGARLALRGIDGFLVRGASFRRRHVKKLEGGYGSDGHRPVTITVTAKK